MYFQISKREFLNALSIAARAISSFSPLPAFSGVKIEVKENYIIITGSDADVSIQTIIKKSEDCHLEIQKMGAIVIEAKYILEIVRKIESNNITVEIIDGCLTHISGNASEFKINGMRASEYPPLDFSKPSENITVKKELLKKMINQTIFATSDKENKPVLTGVNFKCCENNLVCVATDSYRLAQKNVILDDNHKFNITIPSKSLQEVLKTMDDCDDIEISMNDKKVQFYIKDTIIQTRLIDGVFPETSRLIPKSFNYELTVDSREILSAIDRASFIKNDGVSVIKFTLSSEGCILSSRSLEVGSSTETLNSANFNGDKLEISCNGKYVFDAIKVLEGELITMKFCGDMKPFIIKANENNDVIQLVLPVRTSV